MRLIHTSDWHLGQHFYGKSRADEHRVFLDWLLLQAEQQQADAIIVAGDLFDTGTPPSYARELYNRFVVALQGRGCQLIVLAGNHDSVATLNESRELLACLHTQVIAGAHADDAPLLLRRRDGSPGAILCAVPFLRPRDLLQSRAGQSAAEKQQALQQAISDHYHTLYQRALALQASLAPDHRRRQRLRIGARYLYRHAGCPAGQRLSPGRLYRPGTHSPPAAGRSRGAYSLQRLPDPPEL